MSRKGRRKETSEEALRRREREAGQRGDATKCRSCEAVLRPFERPEGLCNVCLKSHPTWPVRSG